MELVKACLAQIDAHNPKLNAFLTITRETALATAQALDDDGRAGRLRGPLHGIPIALKDNIDTAGIRTTAASAVFDNRVPDLDAEVVQRLKNAGAVVIGKTNLHEFASGGTSAVSYYGPVRNPWDLERHPGGSSGGSAVAVAAGMCFGALGTDTGGSIRGPASLCGVVGYKPTYGLVPIRGIVPLAWTLDHCGPLARTVEDCALLLQTIAGPDPLDMHSVASTVDDYAAAMKVPVKELRLGVLRIPYFDHLQADHHPVVEAAIAAVMKMTRSAKDVRLPIDRDIGLVAETYSYHEELFKKSAARYQIPTRQMLEAASSGLAADYVRDLRIVRELRHSISSWFDTNAVDLLVLPTMRRIPLPISEVFKQMQSYALMNPELENTGVMNVLGIPSITVPCGFTEKGLPVGLMIAGRPWADGQVLSLAYAYEQAHSWYNRRPKLTLD
jgi:aspartyl-tRNA(Asn)/glutamyl-tRNA(Gln) amidotransferase subunit A